MRGRLVISEGVRWITHHAFNDTHYEWGRFRSSIICASTSLRGIEYVFPSSVALQVI
jgi:hypothetical protein